MKIPKKYIHQSGNNKGKLKQKLLQTGCGKAYYSFGDAHPFVKGLFYRQSRSDRSEIWCDKATIEKDNRRKYEYAYSAKGIASRLRYNQTDKGKKSLAKATANFRGTHKQKSNNRRKCSKRRAVIKKTSCNLCVEAKQLVKHFYDWSVRLESKLGIKFHVDHIVPLSRGGLHHPSNLQVVPAVWNMRKYNNNANRWLSNGL
tara:strand:+ start:2714 stop:3316 length:603 start_codon:yes stop_codon:yes gene_type:complete